MALEPNAIARPALHAAVAGASAAARINAAPSAVMAPVASSASTSTKRPATSGSTDHDTPAIVGHGDVRDSSVTTTTVATPQTAVGRPSGRSRAETTRSATAVRPSPVSAVTPPFVQRSTSTQHSQVAASRRPSVSRSAIQVAPIAASAGTEKRRSQSTSGGMCSPYRTRFAGFEIGSRKLAALATKAQMKRYGSGSTRALRVAASTAGVSTTAVASFDRKIVTTMPTTKIAANRRRGDPRAWLTASAATRSKSPSRRAASDSSIIPTRNR